MSYWSEANPGTRAIHTAFKLDRMGVSSLWLPSERMPVHPSEFAVASVNPIIPTLFAAEKARLHADSYRGFLVGAAAVAYFFGPQGGRKLMLQHGANIKPIEGSDTINIHAEHIIMAAIEASRRPDEKAYVSLLAVVGDLQPDQQSGNESLTLPPCGVCRNAFNQPDTPVDERTLFVTANPAFTTLEWFSLSALNAVHRGEYAETGIALFPQRSPILTPPDFVPGEVLCAADFDTPEMDRAEDEYEQKVMFPAIDYVKGTMVK